VTPRTVPSAPTIGTAAPGARSATVRWTAPTSNGGSAITGYRVLVYSGTSSLLLKTVSASATATSLRVTGLLPGLRYSFTVRAVNAVGTGPASRRSNAVRPTLV